MKDHFGTNEKNTMNSNICYLKQIFMTLLMYMLRFKYIFGLKYFKPAWFLFPCVSDYGNKYDTMENKIQTSLKILHQR